MNIADRIHNLRKIRGISQEELADKIGVSRQAVSKWEGEQSIPDVDKVIIMSDYFEVTTDYILKGIDNENQTTDIANANIFTICATALNFIGFIIAAAIWYEEQIVIATGIGLIIVTTGCVVFGIGQTISTQNLEKAKQLFWKTNIWLLAFIALSIIYNLLSLQPVAPYPLFSFYGLPLIMTPIFGFSYIAICLHVFFTQIKKN